MNHALLHVPSKNEVYPPVKYYALSYNYDFSQMVTKVCNIGDNFQSFAVCNALKKNGITSDQIGFLDRETLGLEAMTPNEGILIAQGWFVHGTKEHPMLPIHPSKARQVLFFGFHLNKSAWGTLKKCPDFRTFMKSHEPIGCRDIPTRDFLRTLKVKAYFSRCLTLTFDKQKEPTGEYIYFIDHNDQVLKYLPPSLAGKEKFLSQEIPPDNIPMGEKDVQNIDDIAKKRYIELKQNAKMIVTKRIHIAMPFSAMGIPVILTADRPRSERISVVKEILPIYGKKKFKRINWNISAPDIEKLKSEILLMFTYALGKKEQQIGIVHNRLSQAHYEKAALLMEKACSITLKDRFNFLLTRFISGLQTIIQARKIVKPIEHAIKDIGARLGLRQKNA
ncbi:polysaccharide pyruvyl transferase family protein [uncultured Desulfobacter sp.]|uniref:polysaccharide pyruvyl transferase family protein n=1 Tax=uncultured Desulfobacter sp. TaxID=240139 RepID=UPI002D1E4227|nr:polysaccharide pyruvyl transferase family protein [uncultured Desulfobacter sp.]